MKPLQTKRCIIEIVVYYASFNGNKGFHLSVDFFFLNSIFTRGAKSYIFLEKKSTAVSLFSHSISPKFSFLYAFERTFFCCLCIKPLNVYCFVYYRYTKKGRVREEKKNAE